MKNQKRIFNNTPYKVHKSILLGVNLVYKPYLYMDSHTTKIEVCCLCAYRDLCIEGGKNIAINTDKIPEVCNYGYYYSVCGDEKIAESRLYDLLEVFGAVTYQGVPRNYLKIYIQALEEKEREGN